MTWILAVVVVGLIAVLAQMVLVYQRRAYDLRMKQEPLRRRLRRHRKEMKEAVERIRLAAEAGLRDIRSDVTERRRQVEPKRHLLLELEHQIREEYAQPEPDETADGKEEPEPEEEEEGGVTAVDLGVRDRGQELRTLVRAVQSKHDELENHLASLARDADIAGRLFDRLQSKLQKDSAGDGQKAKPAEPEEP